jgi:hypothetical protein
MKVGDFMDVLRSRTMELLPAELRSVCSARVRFVWFQVHFHSPKVHYEVWLARKIERIEIGLHFEGPHDFSYQWASLIAEHMAEIQSQVGPSYELEEWTASWCRLHETLPYDPPSEVLADEIAHRFARLISVCEPIVAGLRDQVPPSLAIEAPRPKGRGRFERKRKVRGLTP